MGRYSTIVIVSGDTANESWFIKNRGVLIEIAGADAKRFGREIEDYLPDGFRKTGRVALGDMQDPAEAYEIIRPYIGSEPTISIGGREVSTGFLRACGRCDPHAEV